MTPTLPILGLIALGWLTSPARRRWLATRRRSLGNARHNRMVATELPELCRSMARRLVAGDTLLIALRESADGAAVQADIERVADDHAHGSTLRRSVERWAHQSGIDELRAFAAAVAIATGPVGPRPELFDSVAVTLRRQRDRRADAEAHAAQALLSSWVIAALPWVVAAAVVAEGGAPAQILLGTPVGRAAVVSAAALEVLGIGWMRRMIRSAIR